MHDYDFKKRTYVHAGSISLALLVSSDLYRGSLAACLHRPFVRLKPRTGSDLLATCEAAPDDIAGRSSDPQHRYEMTSSPVYSPMLNMRSNGTKYAHFDVSTSLQPQ